MSAGVAARVAGVAGPTFPLRLAAHAIARPAAVALQDKRHGIWHPITWSELAASVRDIAHGLASLGVARGDVVGIVGDNRPEWLIAELAAQSLGAAIAGVDPTRPGDEVQRILALAGARVVVAEDQEQVDKLLPAALDRVIYYDPHGLEHYRHEVLARFTDVAAAGRRDAATRPGWLDGEIAAGAAGDCAVVCATGARLSRLSFADLLAMADHLHRIDPLRPGQRHVSFLPLAWVGEQVLAVACGLAHGLTLAFPEDTATQQADLREIGPDVMLAPPPIWDSLRAAVQRQLDEADWLKRRAFAWAYGVGDAIDRARKPGLPLAAAHAIADAIALRQVRDRLGLSRLRRGYVAGTLSPDVARFFRAIGVSLEEVEIPGSTP